MLCLTPWLTSLGPFLPPRSTYDRIWQEAMSELNEQIHIEDDTLDMEPGDKRGPVMSPASYRVGPQRSSRSRR